MPIAQTPRANTPVPDAVARIAGDATARPVWRNEQGGIAFRIDDDEPRFVKWNPAGSTESLTAEAERMRWLEGRHPAPRVLELVHDGDDALLVTAAIPGRSAVDARWLAEPATAVRAIATGLRRLHALDVDACPFDWSPASRIAEAVLYGREVPEALHEPPAIDRLVVCHGDPCSPNTLLGDDGTFCATVDVGRLGVADRWADLAVASMALEWNYGAGFEPLFWAAYGIRPDDARIAYYRALWDAT